MSLSSNIYNSKELRWKDKPSPFVIKTLDELRMDIASHPHRHNYYSVIWSFSSAGKHVVDHMRYDFQPKTIWFIPPVQVHCIEPPQPQGIMLLFVPEFVTNSALKASFLNQLELFRAGSLPLYLTEVDAAQLMQHTIAISDAFFGTHPFRTDTIEAHLKLFLLYCNDLYVRQQKLEAGVLRREHPSIANFKNLVHKHLSEWHKVEQYAEALCLTTAYFTDLYKQATGETPKEYISTQIVAEARRMALFTDLSMKEIGYQLGFDDASRFSHFFKSQTGESFLSFRQSIT